MTTMGRLTDDCDRILPVQYAALFQGRARTCGETLALAVLEQAVRDLQRYRRPRFANERRLYREAEKWIRSSDRLYVFSFVNICELLGLSPSALRARLLGTRRPLPAVLDTAA